LKQNPKLPGMPGPTAAALDAQEETTLAAAALHRALGPLLEQLPPSAEATLVLHFNVLGDALTISIKPKKGE